LRRFHSDVDRILGGFNWVVKQLALSYSAGAAQTGRLSWVNYVAGVGLVWVPG